MTMVPPSTHQIELFMSLFRGRTDVYARRWEKDGKSDYSPAYEFEKEVSFDRFFPNQDTPPKAGFGNLITLPLQGMSASQHNTVFLAVTTGAPFQNQ